MGDILGHQIPTGGVKGKIVAVALISVPVAALLGIGLGARALYKRIRRPETPEEQFERLRKAAYRDGLED